MSTTIQETIDRLRELEQKASPTPWRTEFDTHIYAGEGEIFEIDTSNDDICEWFECSDECGCAGYERKPDIDLFVASRNALPALLAEIDRLTAENAKAWEDGYKTAASAYYDDLSEPDGFAQEARMNSPYQEKK